MPDIASDSLDQLYRQLQSGPQGLSARTASRRAAGQAKRAGIHARVPAGLKLFLHQFSNPLMLLLLVVVVLSALLGEKSDTFIVFFILLLSGLFSFLQEYHAGRAVKKLLELVEVRHQVLREGRQQSVKTPQVVPGDVVLLQAGDLVPADCRLLDSNELHVNESTLTGESFPVAKAPGLVAEETPLSRKSNCLWQGTSVVSGTARALAVLTGPATVFGQMAHSLTLEVPTAFETGLRNFGYFLLRLTVLLSAFVLVTNLYFHKPFFNSLLFSLALAIGMAPELLPAIMTFAMSAGARRMRRHKVIVKRLSSIFNFGEVNVLCTDKTGTITEGAVSLLDIVNPAGQPDARARQYAFLNASFQNGSPNPIDEVIRSLALPTAGYEKTDEIPFDFIRKRLSIVVKGPEGYLLLTKGALLPVLAICSLVADEQGRPQALEEPRRRQLEKQLAVYSQQGLRVLGLASRQLDKADIGFEEEQQMVFRGFILLEDKLKQGVKASLIRLEKMGIRVKIITGDNRYATLHTAQALGMPPTALLTGEELNTMSPEALIVRAAHTQVFTEIEPHQKERIIRALQHSRFRVAYLGDGINDAAAIHAADTGISTSNAVDVAREAADFVLLEKDLGVLADGVMEGRKSFANCMKYVFATTGATFGNMFSVAGASLLLPFLPMLPQQLLLTNLLSDFPYLAVASDRVEEEQLRRPLTWDLHLIRRFMLVFGLHSSVFDFATFYTLYYYFNLRDKFFQTGWFLESTVTELIIIFIVRTRRPIFKSRPGRLLAGAAALALVLTLWLPFSFLAPALCLQMAHRQQAWALVLLVAAYGLTAAGLQHWFFRIFAGRSSRTAPRH